MSTLIPEQQKVVESASRAVEIFVNSQGEIRPHGILLGPSGSGKTHIVKEIAKKFGLATCTINAAGLTKEGTSGNSLSKALAPIKGMGHQLGICFVDEFDKMFISGNTNSDLAHETTNGVQNEFLTILEGDKASVFGDYGKYDIVNVDNILFLFAGAFNGEPFINRGRLMELGVKTEFLGRVPLLLELEKISVKSLYSILQELPLFLNYLKLYPECNKQQVEKLIMHKVMERHPQSHIGVRLLTDLVNNYFINGEM